MSDSPVFYDPRGRRARRAAFVSWILGGIVVLAFVLVAVAVVFGTSLPDLRIVHRPTTFQDPLRIEGTGKNPAAFRMRQRLLADVRRRQTTVGTKKATARIVLGYYAPYESTGLQSLRRHAGELTHIAPEWLHLKADGGSIDDARDFDPKVNPKTAEVEQIARRWGLRVIPILDNYGRSDFDRSVAARLLHSPANQTAVARELVRFLTSHGFDGIHLDFEKLNADDNRALVGFAARLRTALAPHHLSLSAAVEIGSDSLDVAALAESCDFVVPMLYDLHDDSGTEGPIAPLDWCESSLEKLLQTVPESKVVLGIGNFGYDWVEGKRGAQTLSFQEAMTTAEGYRSESPDKVLRFDEATSNTTFAYRDDEDRLHRVWLLDAVSAYNQIRSAGDLGLRGAALWNLGSEDPAIWSFLNERRLFGRVAPSALERIDFANEVSFTGRGEILDVQSLPTPGRRAVAVDEDGLVESCRTLQYASPLLVRKSGFVPKKIALTFDDGPDAQWTPQILDVLKRYRVPATFFDIGANAESMAGLVRREYDEGHEVGNHSFTHPDLGSVSRWRAKAEITLTQMAIEGATGHSSVLFRPPYNADSEPETPDQLDPVLQADQMGYVTVGENVDPTDWDPTVRNEDGASRPRTAEDIANAVVDDLRRRQGTDDEGNIVLLHDAGGDRSQTVRALTMLIPRLRAEGYEFVTTSRLMGKTRDGVMPPISAGSRLSYVLGRWALGSAFAFLGALAVAFRVAVFLGIARIALVLPLALVRRRREIVPRPLAKERRVSVVIAAYNEASVIVRTVESVLASDWPLDEVWVVDDGSTDGTGDVARKAFGEDPRVSILTKPNGGKASALNEGIARAGGELLFHIDADTILDREAIGRLATHFADERVAAVAGDVQVGNRINLLTQWQDLEYVTSQNLDRRAYAALNCITVVPGAIGMWRREAVVAVGGYQTDTLAEDMDLTWRLRRAGYRLENEPDAHAYTEAPERFGPFLRQRFRWSYGTLQCLVKHRGALGRHGWFGRLALPVQWAFGVVFQALAPLVDLQVLIGLAGVAATLLMPPTENRAEETARAMSNLLRFWDLYLVFLGVELLGAAVALRLERRSLWNLFPLLLQRLVYRQMMYAVMFKSLVRALSGEAAGWGKLARTGSVKAPTP